MEAWPRVRVSAFDRLISFALPGSCQQLVRREEGQREREALEIELVGAPNGGRALLLPEGRIGAQDVASSVYSLFHNISTSRHISVPDADARHERIPSK